MTFRWGLVGHGYISGQFLGAIPVVDGAEATIVLGRNRERAAAYAAEHELTAVGTVEEFAASGVDAAYICTPHTAHLDVAVELLAAGIPVLVEKPMTPNAADTRRLVRAAKDTGTFAMEAVWTRFLPIYDVVRSWITDGRIGEVLAVNASFGFQAAPDPAHRLFDPARAGGSILDIGLYPLTVADMLCGPALDLRAVGHVGNTGVDEHVVVAGHYPNGVVAQLSSSLRSNLPNSAEIVGSLGSIELPWFFAASSATLTVGDERETAERPHPGNGFEYEIAHVMEMIATGSRESSVMSFATSLRIAEACDDLRRQVGVRYPFED